MSITCYVVDDESKAVELLKEYIERTPDLELVGSSQNPLNALDFLTSANAPDLTFVDIDMRLLSGMELAGMVNLYTTVIFTTAFPEYALQAFENEAFDYLLKPINYNRFAKCIQRVRRKRIKLPQPHYSLRQDFFNVKSEVKGRMYKVRFDEVMYVEGADNYILIHTPDENHLTYLTLKEIEHHLPGDVFVRIHRSFVINLNYVRIIERNRVILTNGEYMVLGNNYKERFLSLMDEHLIKTGRAS
jgi:DNA-binding LytR/AlgR family response regulator